MSSGQITVLIGVPILIALGYFVTKTIIEIVSGWLRDG